ncbi:hypothetical protein CC1G_12060 [Coprinopsis cinerea okayama7|uniref:Uncharacterized protein n=1 Tax=Coprinopsis cinerea (strain Okayama-7 / 130 / ATCC MYA-4618 / FGSC 9003) TaxID=240176 RepID=A8N0C9_COPC7|nr:hypothetical protein CC1G_12060 [Coprinopsis cinerea okayama7\|eukprot:XP_001828330.1 hypothetical protein CC1G_12060 [Coprinopsis cinerea okayama7\
MTPSIQELTARFSAASGQGDTNIILDILKVLAQHEDTPPALKHQIAFTIHARENPRKHPLVGSADIWGEPEGPVLPKDCNVSAALTDRCPRIDLGTAVMLSKVCQRIIAETYGGVAIPDQDQATAWAYHGYSVPLERLRATPGEQSEE